MGVGNLLEEMGASGIQKQLSEKYDRGISPRTTGLYFSGYRHINAKFKYHKY